MKRIEDYIIAVPDFPKPGVLFRDITGILSDPDGLKLTLDAFYKTLENVDLKGKLPRETVEITYNLEYGTACMEVHKDAIKPGQRVVIVDDLLATGGTAKAAAHLVEKMGGKVECFAFVIELAGLKGREVLDGYRVESLTKF